MALAPGTKLGPYEIQSPLGAAGRGEVCRARDFDSGHVYAIPPGGKNFIFIREDQPAHASADIQLVLNWFEELKRRVPAAKP